jgi:hypothetical protein
MLIQLLIDEFAIRGSLSPRQLRAVECSQDVTLKV